MSDEHKESPSDLLVDALARLIVKGSSSFGESLVFFGGVAKDIELRSQESRDSSDSATSADIVFESFLEAFARLIIAVSSTQGRALLLLTDIYSIIEAGFQDGDSAARRSNGRPDDPEDAGSYDGKVVLDSLLEVLGWALLAASSAQGMALALLAGIFKLVASEFGEETTAELTLQPSKKQTEHRPVGEGESLAQVTGPGPVRPPAPEAGRADGPHGPHGPTSASEVPSDDLVDALACTLIAVGSRVDEERHGALGTGPGPAGRPGTRSSSTQRGRWFSRVQQGERRIARRRQKAALALLTNVRRRVGREFRRRWLVECECGCRDDDWATQDQ